MQLTLLFRWILLSIASPALAASYSVSPTGSDTAAGTSSAPWKTIGHAISVAKAGDTVTIAPGTYPGSLTFSNSGTASAPITFLGNTASPNVIISSDIDISGAYVILKGITITGYNPGAAAQQTAVTFDNGSSHCQFVNGFIHDLNDVDCFHFWGSYNLIGYNTITNIYYTSDSNHTDFVQIWGNGPNPSQFNAVIGNVLVNCSLDCITIEGANNSQNTTNSGHDLIIANNVFYGSFRATGLANTLRNSGCGQAYTYWWNNIIMNCSGNAGVAIIFYDGQFSNSNGTYSLNSSFYDEIINNVFVNNGTDVDFNYGPTVGHSGAGNLTTDNCTASTNYFSSTGPSSWAGGVFSGSLVNSPFGTGAVNGGDPGFNQVWTTSPWPLTANFTTKTGSQLRGVGTNLSTAKWSTGGLVANDFPQVLLDVAGNSRPATGAWDVGPYQSGSTGTPTPEPTPAPPTNLHIESPTP